MSDKIITRFAPSPTGYLHVGGARTALFNFLFARKNTGLFLLRIEDTDLQRSSAEMTQKILTDLSWMGLDWDDQIIYQAQNIERHRQIARIIWENGFAYPCFCNEADLKIHRKEYKYDRYCFHLSSEDVERKLAEKIPYSLRIKIPEGNTAWTDFIHGEIIVQNEEIEDFVIQVENGRRTKVQVERTRDSSYWKDVGSVDSYYETSMDLIGVDPVFNLYGEKWVFRTYERSLPPSKCIIGGRTLESMVSDGCIISGGLVQRSILSPGVIV